MAVYYGLIAEEHNTMAHAPDFIAEQALIEVSRLQRAVMEQQAPVLVKQTSTKR